MIKQASARLRPTNGHPPLREVALVGFGASKDLMLDLDTNIPIWSLNAAEDHQFPRIDRIFEMHKLRDVILETPRWERIQSELPYPTFMLEAYSELPSSVRYEIETILDLVFENIYLGDNEHAIYMDASLCYMIASAVIEKFDVIRIMGFELKTDTEYRYQRPGAFLMIGWAAGKGVKMVLPEDSQLMPKTLYGYDDYQSISRQNAEQWLHDMQIQESEWIGRMNTAHAKVVERQGKSLLFKLANWFIKFVMANTDIDKAAEERNEAYRNMYMRQGAIHILLEQINIMDRKQESMENIEFKDQYIMYEDAPKEKTG